MMDRDQCNGFRFQSGSRTGHYESYFQRANHPSRPLAFWIRYTLFSPKEHPEQTIGERWAVWFDGEHHQCTAVRDEFPLSQCDFSSSTLRARIDEATLDAQGLRGLATSHGHKLEWELQYTSPEAPLLLLPERYYSGGFPKAKALVGAPLAKYSGTITVDGKQHHIEQWVGSQNHNWGSQHTNEYAWGQVAGFDNAPDSFLELSTARVKMGPIRTPWISLVVLRHEGETYACNGLLTGVRANGAYKPFHWTINTEENTVKIQSKIEALPEHFVALPYRNPPGGTKWCHNSKIASCTVQLERPNKPAVRLHTDYRAAFELLYDTVVPGIRRLGD